MDLPSFLWLWRIAAWSMGFSLLAYACLGVSGLWIAYVRRHQQRRPHWLRPVHIWIGSSMIFLVLLLLTIGIIGTLGYYGSLGHSVHLATGLTVVGLVLLSGWSATQIHPTRAWARSLHVGCNIILFLGFLAVSLTGWDVVQKYLP